MITLKPLNTICALTVFGLLLACSGNNLEEKGFSVNTPAEDTEADKIDGISKDSLSLATRPSSVLLTGIPRYRLTSVYKVNYNKRDKTTFIGSDSFYHTYSETTTSAGNQWNYNFMPGLSAAYGYNMVNVSHYDVKTQKRKDFFEKPVLVKTLYYPSFSRDTLNHKPVHRNFFMISAYDDDTNKDGFINANDLRRFYYFDINAVNRRPLVPANYSVIKSEYDPANDFMYVFAKLDANQNGQGDDAEDIHIFWIDLKNPENTGRQY